MYDFLLGTCDGELTERDIRFHNHHETMTEDQYSYVAKPGTNEYEVLSFLVSHERNRFSLSQIAKRTGTTETTLSNTVSRLVERGLIEQSAERYYVDPEDAERLHDRLKSVDAAVRLHENAPDDAYSQEGWEDDQ